MQRITRARRSLRGTAEVIACIAYLNKVLTMSHSSNIQQTHKKSALPLSKYKRLQGPVRVCQWWSMTRLRLCDAFKSSRGEEYISDFSKKMRVTMSRNGHEKGYTAHCGSRNVSLLVWASEKCLHKCESFVNVDGIVSSIELSEKDTCEYASASGFIPMPKICK